MRFDPEGLLADTMEVEELLQGRQLQVQLRIRGQRKLVELYETGVGGQELREGLRRVLQRNAEKNDHMRPPLEEGQDLNQIHERVRKPLPSAHLYLGITVKGMLEFLRIIGFLVPVENAVAGWEGFFALNSIHRAGIFSFHL